MASQQNEIVEQLKDVGNRLLKFPSPRDELLRLLEELENILTKVDQAPPKAIQEALLPAMEALISDPILKNSDSDIKITVAVCFNELMRVTAPDSPYEDSRMKEIFELIVASFDKLSLLSGISYSKALSIIENVSKVRSCVMMLDIECEKLIIEMFQQFERNLRPDHPASVFTAMDDIMSHVIDESEDIPLDLLKVLLDYVRKEKENTSSISWKLGASVVRRNSDKIKPYLRDAVKSGDINKADYAPLIDSMLKLDSDIRDQNHVAVPTKQSVPKKSPADALVPENATKSGDASAKPVKASGLETLINASAKTELKSKPLKDNERNVPEKGIKAPSTKLPMSPPQDRPKKSSVVVKNDHASKDAMAKKGNEMLTNPEKKNQEDRPKKSSVAVKNDHASKDVVAQKENETLTNPEKKNQEDWPKKSSVALKNDHASKDVVAQKENETLTNPEKKNQEDQPKKSSAAVKNDHASKDVVAQKENETLTNPEKKNQEDRPKKSSVAVKNDHASKDVVAQKENETLTNPEKKNQEDRPKKSSVAVKNDHASKDSVVKKEKETLTNPEKKNQEDRPKKSSTAVKNDHASKDVVLKKENETLTNPEKKNQEESLVQPNRSGKKLDRQKKAMSGGSGKKRLSSNSGTSSSDKEKNGMNETEKRGLRRKRDEMEEEVFETPFGKKKYKQDIVGCKLKVYWPKDKAYYEGRVTDYNPVTKKHRVDYDDGDVEVLNLVTEIFEFIGDEIAVKKPHRESSSHEKKAKQNHSAKKTETPKSAPKDSNAA